MARGLDDDALSTLARDIRADALRMVHCAHASHIGSCLSMAELLAVLYGVVLNIDPLQPNDPGRDRFILSKGHGTAILYAVLAERGFFNHGLLGGYCADGSLLMGHASHKVPGVEFSTGSLGHGLPVACGIALAAARSAETFRTLVLVGDGELDEGSNWEAAMFAGAHHLSNLTVVVDRNRMQALGSTDDVLDLEPLAEKFAAFGWEPLSVDGHDVTAVREVLQRVPFTDGKPSVVIANTVKGKGVSFMENALSWHYKSPSGEQLARALRELGVE